MAKIRATNENLKKHATKPLTQWLIDAAKRRRSITYGEVERRLEAEIGFSYINPRRVGIPAGALMSDIQKKWPEKKKKWPEKCPLLNILLVRQDILLPGDGAGPFMARYLNDRDLKSNDFRQKIRRDGAMHVKRSRRMSMLSRIGTKCTIIRSMNTFRLPNHKEKKRTASGIIERVRV